MKILNLTDRQRHNEYRAVAGGGGGSTVPVIESTTTEAVDYSTSPVSEVVIDKPTGVATNDLILIIVAIDFNGTSASVWDETYKPTGFTILSQTDHIGASDIRLGIFYKIADGTEGASFTVPLDKETSSSHGVCGFCSRISGVNTSSPIDQTGTWATVRHTISGITTSEDYTLAFYGVAGDGGDTQPYAEPSLWTELVDFRSAPGNGGVGCSLAVGYKDMETAGTTGDAETTNSSNDGFTGVQFNIKGN